jgi:hypothetical protein
MAPSASVYRASVLTLSAGSPATPAFVTVIQSQSA